MNRRPSFAWVVLLSAVWVGGVSAQRPGLGSVPRTQPAPVPPIRSVPTVSPPTYPWPVWGYPPVYHPPVLWPPSTHYYRCWGGVWTPVYCAYTSPFAAPPGYLPWHRPWPYPAYGW